MGTIGTEPHANGLAFRSDGVLAVSFGHTNHVRAIDRALPSAAGLLRFPNVK